MATQPTPISSIPRGEPVTHLPLSQTEGEGPLGRALADMFGGGGGGSKPKKAKSKETEAQKQAAAQRQQEAAYQAQIKAVESSPWTQLGNALASQYAQATTAVTPLISGAATAPAVQGAASSALADLGLSPGSSAASWLAGQEAGAAAMTAPVANAMRAQGAQYAAEAGPITQAVMAYGQANALEDITAPEASWLNALASHVTSNLSYYGEVPKADIPVLESGPGLVSALEQAGGYAAGTSGSGLVPLNELPTVPGGKVTTPSVGSYGTVGVTPSGGIPRPGVSAGS